MTEFCKNLSAGGTPGRTFSQSSGLAQEKRSALNHTLKAQRQGLSQGKRNLKMNPLGWGVVKQDKGIRRYILPVLKTVTGMETTARGRESVML